MKVSYYILQKDENDYTRELPFVSDINNPGPIMESMEIKLADVDFVVSRIFIQEPVVKVICKMKYNHFTEHIEKTFHRF